MKAQNLFYSIGIFWRRDLVKWKASTNAKLLGRLAGKATAPEVNFCDQRGIYVLYSDFTPVYAGQAGKKGTLFRRLKDHTKDHVAERWDRFSWFGVRDVTKNGRGVLAKLKRQFHPKLEETLDQLEAVLLYTIEFSHNLQRGKLKKALKFVTRRFI
jgi:hypothetical protein